MTTTINADTSTGGAVISGDASGVLGLQAAGSTQVTINGSGVVLANPLPVGSGGTGATSLSGITAGSATNLAGGSAGTVPYQSASGTTQMLAAGTSGQVLQSNGAAAPSWATPSTGAMVLLASDAVYLASALDFTGFVSSTYHSYMVVFNATDFTSGSPGGGLQVYIGGVLQTSANYKYSGFYTDSAGSGLLNRYDGGATYIRLSNGSNLNQFGTICFTANSLNYLTGTATPTFICNVGGGSSVSTTFYQIGSYNSTSPITGIRILSLGGGTITGIFRLYGIKNT